ncbi:MAG: carboxypeptidase regulatory-like domain-containing protein [Bacteroidetes bacterium]|nr:carboxypeptidase regulatory-like domain-containing protein [Bacteroidota bacterium]
MKKFYTFVLASITTATSFAQAPTIYGTFLPVNGTQVKEVWDTTTNILPMPVGGSTAKTWDYSTNFQSSDTFTLVTKSPGLVATAKIPNSGKDATNSVFVRAVQKAATADSLVLFYKLNYDGFYTIGAHDEKTSVYGFKKLTNKPYEFTKPELVVPFEMTYPQTSVIDTMRAQSTMDVSVFGTVTHVIVRMKTMSSEGFGTLKTPAGTFTGVLLTKEIVTEYDTVYNASNVKLFSFTSTLTRYSFLRNNSFASTVLMFIQDSDNDNKSNMAWYTLPVEFGSISGTAYDSSGTATLGAGNEVWLYREFSNFTKNDALAKTKTDASGKYKFDSIPYGYYRVAVRPDSLQYPNSLTTYFGDTAANSAATWLDADTINTIGCKCNVTGKDITIKYHAPQNNPVTISGSITTTFPFVNLPQKKSGGSGKNDFSVMATNDVKGIDIIIKKKPNGGASLEVTTDQNGVFGVGNLNPGNYDVVVDVPGLEMAGTYSFTIPAGTTTITCLDFTINPDSINPSHPSCLPLAVKELNSSAATMSVYPNPYSTNTQISLQLTEKANVVMELYNCLGQKISTIENMMKPAGSYMYQVGNDQIKASGIYFIRMTANGEYKTLKVIKE